MKTNLRKIQSRRLFSAELKLKAVKDYETGKMTALELCKFYEVSERTIYDWLYKYSKFQKKSIRIVEMAKSNTQKIKDLETKVKVLERVVGVKQMNIDFLEKMVEIAKEEYDIDIKKNSSTPQSNGSKTTKKK